MKNAANSPNSRRSTSERWILRGSLLAAIIFYGAAALLVLSWSGCASTVRPKIVTSSQASWDGTNQNSGLIGITPDGRRIITPHARDRYNALMNDWGEFFVPPVHPDDGLTATGTNTFLIDPQHEEDFIRALEWQHQKNPPWHK